MKLQQAWHEVDYRLEHIARHTNDLRQKVLEIGFSETTLSGTSILEEIEVAEKEVNEALRLSKSANKRLLNLYSHRRKKNQDGTLDDIVRVSET